MASHTDLISVWSHYHRVELKPGLKPEVVERQGNKYSYFPQVYGGRAEGTFWVATRPRPTC